MAEPEAMAELEAMAEPEAMAEFEAAYALSNEPLLAENDPLSP